MKRNTSFKPSRHLSGSIFGDMPGCVKSQFYEGQIQENCIITYFQAACRETRLFGKFKWHAHGWADDAIIRQNLIKIMAYY